MSTKTVCDQCGKENPRWWPPKPEPFLRIKTEEQVQGDKGHADYCSRRCAVLAPGGAWTIENITEVDLQDDEFRTIPWPPSDELVERVAGAIGQYAPQRDPDEHELLTKIARAVLDAIGGDHV